MKAIQFLIFISFFSSFLFLNSCASISGFQTGRTVEKGRGEIGMGLNLARSPNFLDTIDVLEDIPLNFIPTFEIGGRYGITERFDIGLRANTALNFLVDAKFQLVGDQESPFALSVGAGFGGFGIAAGSFALLNFQLPLYMSYHPTEKLSIYASPRYIGQFPTGFVEYSGLLNYTGANFGVLFGDEVKFGVDFGYFNVSNSASNFKNKVYNIGIGLVFEL